MKLFVSVKLRVVVIHYLELVATKITILPWFITGMHAQV